MLVATAGMAPAHLGPTGTTTSANSALAKGASEESAMANAPVQLGQDPQFEPFLYAPVGEDRHGDTVTVLSMLARLGIDPWGEAKELAKLPHGAARQRLEALMARFSDVATLVTDRNKVISRLLAVLPGKAMTSGMLPNTTPSRPALPPYALPFFGIIAAILVLACLATLAQTH